MKNKLSVPRFEKVLLIDDNTIDNYINERIILASSFAKECIVHTSGLRALKYLQDYSDRKIMLPHFIFLDLNMPVMDGFQFLDEFNLLTKKHPVLKDYCRIIVLSSSVSPGDINRVSSCPHVIKYINKPISEDYLHAIN